MVITIIMVITKDSNKKSRFNEKRGLFSAYGSGVLRTRGYYIYIMYILSYALYI